VSAAEHVGGHPPGNRLSLLAAFCLVDATSEANSDAERKDWSKTKPTENANRLRPALSWPKGPQPPQSPTKFGTGYPIRDGQHQAAVVNQVVRQHRLKCPPDTDLAVWSAHWRSLSCSQRFDGLEVCCVPLCAVKALVTVLRPHWCPKPVIRRVTSRIPAGWFTDTEPGLMVLLPGLDPGKVTQLLARQRNDRG